MGRRQRGSAREGRKRGREGGRELWFTDVTMSRPLGALTWGRGRCSEGRGLSL